MTDIADLLERAADCIDSLIPAGLIFPDSERSVKELRAAAKEIRESEPFTWVLTDISGKASELVYGPALKDTSLIVTPLYTHPISQPKRLSDDEIDHVYSSVVGQNLMVDSKAFANAIMDKLENQTSNTKLDKGENQ